LYFFYTKGIPAADMPKASGGRSPKKMEKQTMTDALPPNIVLVTCDQMRSFDVGCYGSRMVKTPNIDRLAKSGVRFDTAIASHPLCTPARSIWLTGQYARTCAGMLGNVHVNPPNAKRERLLDPTLPELMREHGYRTALIGKWHVDPQPQMVGFDKALYPMVAHRNYGQTVFDENATPRIVDGFLEDYFADAVESFLGECKGQPFFLNYNISPPHQPIGPGHLPDQYTRMYSSEHIQLRPNTDLRGAKPPHDPTFWFKVYRSADYFWDYKEKRPIKPADDMLPDGFGLRDLTALYYGGISCVDDYIGRLMDALERHGQLDRTIILFTSDHGDMLGSHGLFNKNRLFEESIRIPFIIAGPNVPPSNPAGFARLIDVAPTLLDAAGLVPPAHMQGRALLREGGADVAFIETGSAIGIRTATHLYGIGYDEKRRNITGDNCVLYDLEQDPYQQKNLAGLSANEQIETSLRERLLAWERDTPWMDSQRQAR
jgi:arylsulfatase A-like enzyme